MEVNSVVPSLAIRMVTFSRSRKEDVERLKRIIDATNGVGASVMLQDYKTRPTAPSPLPLLVEFGVTTNNVRPPKS